MINKRTHRKYTAEFKKYIVQLHKNGKPGREIINEYDLTESVFYKWVREKNAKDSSVEKDDRTIEDEKYIMLLKENANLKTENANLRAKIDIILSVIEENKRC